ncbi:hypothetical protein RJC13_04620 [Staphylococcus hominis]|uniref:hypothetical protein n=1 Tax=Staphylococcus hominis TaxID=1290 RepID=UPI00091E76B6|nr:hypothetical protein [Staphylococcus hominis]MDU3828721.1 hypothetical protein [Staphylococcus sp.]MCI2872915.1 hypothetical protein [Staphylococcus hominis]MDS3895733.1 hypothetical protein [Staphylococcus hominis]MDU7693956.1 hypothetical protein [Staphylococcus sp.]RNE52732.1 hypothetical protein EEI51_05800 [Staphylococcus hominis]
MAKIKRKVEMTLPELIQWGWKNHITEKAFYSNLDGGSVYFDNLQNVSTEHEIAINETFTVEIEEEVTEDTKLPKCLEISFDRKSGRDIAVVYENCSVKQLTDRNPEHLLDIRTIHLVNDDGTVKLIWKNGELVGDE